MEPIASNKERLAEGGYRSLSKIRRGCRVWLWRGPHSREANPEAGNGGTEVLGEERREGRRGTAAEKGCFSAAEGGGGAAQSGNGGADAATVPLEKIEAAMADHMAFLDKHYNSGDFIVSGRQEPRQARSGKG